MALISLHRRYQFVDYQNRLCSIATLITILTLICAIFFPFIFIYKLNNNKIVANDNLIIYEKPYIKFQYKYLMLIENSFESQMVACSSFQEINKLTSEIDSCSQIKVQEKDLNFDGTTDEISLTTEFHSADEFGVKFISIFLLFEAKINNQCEFNIPTALIINKKFFPENLHDRDIVINGNLNVHQMMSLQCPFFIRNIKSHFFLDLVNENRTDLSEYQLKNIERKLHNNPAYFYFDEQSTHIGDLRDGSTSLTIRMRIQELPIRYKKSFWQNVSDVWIVYLSLAIVSFFIANYFLTFLFTNHWLVSRKRNYFANKFD